MIALVRLFRLAAMIALLGMMEGCARAPTPPPNPGGTTAAVGIRESNPSESTPSSGERNKSSVAQDEAALSAPAQTSELRKSGACTLREAPDALDETKAFKVTLENDALRVRADLHGRKFFNDFAVIANAGLSNKSGKPLSVHYNAAFFDNNGDLIASASQDCDLEANDKEVQLASCLSKLPRTAFERIASYKIVIYTEPGKPRG
jgi:hypothetical protein